jgi:hypothetical protein
MPRIDDAAGAVAITTSLDTEQLPQAYLHFAVVRPRLMSACIVADSLPA